MCRPGAGDPPRDRPGNHAQGTTPRGPGPGNPKRAWINRAGARVADRRGSRAIATDGDKRRILKQNRENREARLFVTNRGSAHDLRRWLKIGR